MMEFLSLPAEVIDGNLLPYLEWNDLLRFRKVCRATKDITDGYMKIHPELGPEIEINEKDKNIREFLGLTVPKTTRLFLNNASGIEFYLNAGEDGDEFLERLGPHVRYLRVNQLYQFLFGKEFDFLGAFVNLESFEAGVLVGCKEGLKRIKGNAALNQAYQLAVRDLSLKERAMFPNVFQQLKALKIGNDQQKNLKNMLEFGAELLYFSKELQVVALPVRISKTFNMRANALGGVDNPMALAFQVIEGYIRHRAIQDSPGGTTSFKMFDFTSFHPGYIEDSRQTEVEYQGSPFFLELCTTCLEFDVKLMNVGPYWFQARNAIEVPKHRSPELGIPILSLVNLHPVVFPLNMPNLERIEIRSTLRSTPGRHWREERPDWPTLKTLEITVDSWAGGFIEYNTTEPRVVNYRTSRNELLKFFFEDITREALIELYLHYKFRIVSGFVSIPEAEQIVSACPNLRKLTLNNWPGTNEAFAKLFSGLPGLEEISLEDCRDLGNVAFVGEDANTPVFLKLTELRKLSLKGLDLMPKITDTLFSSVIRHLKLTHLTLTSGDPVNSITVGGIRSLLDGRFAESIEKFSFQDWSLVNVSYAEFKMLEQEFRSYYML